jgi:CRISPR/Cas system CSM-associated protein Csm4 (group 5 of RAMP superfamily)
VLNERAKIQEQRKLQPNVAERLSESINQRKDYLPSYSLPLQKKMYRPPKPASKSKKHEITIVDQLQESKNTGYSGTTPKSRSSTTKAQLKEIVFDFNTPSWNSYANSGRKCYR